MQQYKRKIRAFFNGDGRSLAVNDDSNTDQNLRIKFHVSKGIESTANTSELVIYNLTESNRNLIGQELTNVEVDAGYLNSNVNTVGRIFQGQIRDVNHERDGADLITTITVGDGDMALRTSTVNHTFPAGTTLSAVVEFLLQSLIDNGIVLGEIGLPDDIPAFARPYTVSGTAEKELDTLGMTYGFYWSIQNGAVEVVAGNKALPRTTVLNRASGMIGYPIITDNGIKVKALINPEIRPGRMLRVESDVVDLNSDDGVYRVGSIDYDADNRGQANSPFFMIIHAESIRDGEVNQGVI